MLRITKITPVELAFLLESMIHYKAMGQPYLESLDRGSDTFFNFLVIMSVCDHLILRIRKLKNKIGIPDHYKMTLPVHEAAVLLNSILFYETSCLSIIPLERMMAEKYKDLIVKQLI